MSDAAPGGQATTLKLAAGFAAVYFIWGSTFLAIRFAVEEIPPFWMASARFLIAGALLCAWRRLVHQERLQAAHWPAAGLVGALLFLGGNGAVVWSEQRVASGLTALLLAFIPLWMVLLDSMRSHGESLTPRTAAGVVLGLAGMALLVEPSRLLGGGQVDPAGAAVLALGSLSWAGGSLISRRLRQPASAGLAAGMQMLAGGVWLAAAGALTGEASRFDPAGIGPRGLLCLAYLTLFGSVVSFTAYTWLLSVTTMARVSTYAYVNPIVAVLIGWLVGGEPLTPRVLVATVVIVTAVALIISARPKSR